MSARPRPQPRPVRSVPSVHLGPGAGPAQPPLPGHRESLQAGAPPRVEAGQVRSHATAAQSRPPRPLPQPGFRSGAESAPTSTGSSTGSSTVPSFARVAPASTCVPRTWRPKQAVQLGSQEQQRQPVGSKVGWDKAVGTPPPDLGQGSGPSPFLPGFGGRSPETKCLGTGATSSSRNQAWGLEL